MKIIRWSCFIGMMMMLGSGIGMMMMLGSGAGFMVGIKDWICCWMFLIGFCMNIIPIAWVLTKEL